MIEHSLNPVLFTIGPFEGRWYGLMYALSFVVIYFFFRHFARKRKIGLSSKDADTLIFAELAALLIGARLFEVIFYNPSYYLRNPAEILMIWHGGLSFHGGLAAMLITGYFFCRAKKVSFLEAADIFVIPIGIALALGRLGNFINGELYGRVTSLPWCFKFQAAEGCRHPSQLYEMAKNLVIFGVIFFMRNMRLPKGFLLGIFLVMYSTMRFFIEFARQPEVMVGALTMGQFLCLFMLAGGLYLLFRKRVNSFLGCMA